MGSELIGTGTLTFTGVSKIGGCIKDVFQSIGIVFGAGSLARTTFMSTGDTIIVILGAKITATHTKVGSVKIRTGTFAFIGIIKGRTDTKNRVDNILIIIGTSVFAFATFFRTGNTIFIVIMIMRIRFVEVTAHLLPDSGIDTTG
jgi:hypothetical protein